MLDKEREYFAQHQTELQREHPDKFVVIVGDRLAGAFPTQEEAIAFGAREFGLTPFLVRNVNQPANVEVRVPALVLGILRGANPTYTIRS